MYYIVTGEEVSRDRRVATPPPAPAHASGSGPAPVATRVVGQPLRRSARLRRAAVAAAVGAPPDQPDQPNEPPLPALPDESDDDVPRQCPAFPVPGCSGQG